MREDRPKDTNASGRDIKAVVIGQQNKNDVFTEHTPVEGDEPGVVSGMERNSVLSPSGEEPSIAVIRPVRNEEAIAGRHA